MAEVALPVGMGAVVFGMPVPDAACWPTFLRLFLIYPPTLLPDRLQQVAAISR